MQRIGALVMGAICVFSSIIVLMTIKQTWDGTWTETGIFYSLVGIIVFLFIVPASLVHAITALFPRILKRWDRAPSTLVEQLREIRIDDLRYMYRVFGWLATIGVSTVLLYVSINW